MAFFHDPQRPDPGECSVVGPKVYEKENEMKIK